MCCNVTYFDSFGCECIPKEILKSIRKKKSQQIPIQHKDMIQ